MKRFKTAKIAFLICTLIVALLALASCSLASEQRSVTGARLNENGELILSYSDGGEENLGAVVGKDGAAGAPGADGKDGAAGTPGKNGKDGKDGEDGKNGEDGTVDITIDLNSDNTAIAAAVSKGLRSTVSIEAYFTKTVYNIYTGTSSESEYGSEGSGVIYKLDDLIGSAYIITNHHVVYDKSSNTSDHVSDDIKVYLYGSEYSEQSFPATYVGGSMTYDIAVLYVESCDALKAEFPAACELADSDKLTVGETSIALGNAEGICIGATSGIISVDSESISMTLADESGSTQRRVIRIDTAVNHGNSGGPLFNDSGELIGIVSAKLETDTVENIGYAIPSNVARAVADNIIDTCDGAELRNPQRATIGISVTPVNSRAEVDTDTGLVIKLESSEVVSVAEGSAADGKLLVGDVLISATLDGKTKLITRNHHLVDIALDLRAGDVLELLVLRDGVETTLLIPITQSNISSVK